MRRLGYFIMLVLLVIVLPVRANNAASSVVQTVSGTFKFLPGRDSGDLFTILKGRDLSLPAKKVKKVKVTGTYSGGRLMTLTEDIDVADETPTYSFTIPVPSLVAAFAKKGKVSSRFGSVALSFANKIQELGSVDQLGSIGSGFTSVGSSVNTFNTPISHSGQMSVKKIVTIKKGGKTRMKGLLNGSGTAKCRFALKINP